MSSVVQSPQQIAELFRVHNRRIDVLCDADALRELASHDPPLVSFGPLWPSTTEEGARVVGELIAAYEEQT